MTNQLILSSRLKHILIKKRDIYWTLLINLISINTTLLYYERMYHYNISEKIKIIFDIAKWSVCLCLQYKLYYDFDDNNIFSWWTNKSFTIFPKHHKLYENITASYQTSLINHLIIFPNITQLSYQQAIFVKIFSKPLHWSDLNHEGWYYQPHPYL